MAGTASSIKEVQVRSFQAGDRPAVRAIALATAMTGQPSSAFFDGDEFLADALTGYFTDDEPESCFVAEIHGTVAGYLIGARDTRLMDTRFIRKWLLLLLGKVFARHGLL